MTTKNKMTPEELSDFEARLKKSLGRTITIAPGRGVAVAKADGAPDDSEDGQKLLKALADRLIPNG